MTGFRELNIQRVKFATITLSYLSKSNILTETRQ